ncbi:MAG: PEGA domain-containing protein [Sulfuritalea sp.]|nr:PEGA domain-containing protein [Sulfuritalea sp.]MDP1984989.1 PEGA domain-containing protein [Sulfuritalea sp.]
MLRMTLPALAGLLLLAAGCSRMPSIPNPLDMVSGPSVLQVESAPAPGAIPLLRNGQTLSLAVAEFTDARPGARGRKLGDIKTTVTNMHSSEIALDRDVTDILSGAARSQLAADGFRLVGAGEPADFRLSGVVKAFSLMIAGRDERVITAEATVREGRSGDVIWSGLVTEKDDRYAGVTGNSRGTIIEYLSEGVSVFGGKVSAAVRDSLVKSYPRSITATQSGKISTIPGVTTLHAPASRDEPVAAAPVAAPAAAPAPRPAPAAAGPAVGYVSVYSTPARAKVYVGDVYYGVTPIKIELPVGVAQLGFKLDGHKPAMEKVAVRRGEVTELEVKLAK